MHPYNQVRLLAREDARKADHAGEATLPSLAPYSMLCEFIPTDSRNFTPVECRDAKLTVDRQVPTIPEKPDADGITYGMAFGESTLRGGRALTSLGETLPGTFTFVSDDVKPHAGARVTTVRFTPDDEANYDHQLCDVTVAVAKQNPVRWVQVEHISLTLG